jgi:hypothetical protein
MSHTKAFNVDESYAPIGTDLVGFLARKPSLDDKVVEQVALGFLSLDLLNERLKVANILTRSISNARLREWG